MATNKELIEREKYIDELGEHIRQRLLGGWWHGYTDNRDDIDRLALNGDIGRAAAIIEQKANDFVNDARQHGIDISSQINVMVVGLEKAFDGYAGIVGALRAERDATVASVSENTYQFFFSVTSRPRPNLENAYITARDFAEATEIVKQRIVAKYGDVGYRFYATDVNGVEIPFDQRRAVEYNWNEGACPVNQYYCRKCSDKSGHLVHHTFGTKIYDEHLQYKMDKPVV